jgi:hypothetical protein
LESGVPRTAVFLHDHATAVIRAHDVPDDRAASERQAEKDQAADDRGDDRADVTSRT